MRSQLCKHFTVTVLESLDVDKNDSHFASGCKQNDSHLACLGKSNYLVSWHSIPSHQSYFTHIPGSMQQQPVPLRRSVGQRPKHHELYKQRIPLYCLHRL